MAQSLKGMRKMIELTGSLICRTTDEAARVRAHLPDHIALTRAEPGCVSFDVLPTDDPLIWTVAERFVHRAAFDAHQTRTAASTWARVSPGIKRVYSVREIGAGGG
jgi:quinol monooxygenase YgiN